MHSHGCSLPSKPFPPSLPPPSPSHTHNAPTHPPTRDVRRPTPRSHRRSRGALRAALDPSEAAGFIHTHLPAAVEQSQWLLQSLQGVADAATDAVEPAMEATKAAAAANNGGWLAGPIGLIEKSIVFIHEVGGCGWV